MPLYEYLCRDCEKQAELLVRSEEQPACPECGGDRLMKLLSVPAAPQGGGSPRSEGPPEGGCGSGCACFPGG